MLLCCLSVKADAYDSVVSKDGAGNFKSVQAAIDAVPIGNSKPYRIFVKKGLYFEKITVPSTKSLIQLVGEDVSSTVILFGDGYGGTSVLTINANDFMMMNITVENTQGRLGDGPQSLAIKANGDRLVFFYCRFISGQDTVLLNKAGSRCYFQDCYIDGNTDFIYGAAISIFEHCIIFPRDRVDGGKGGYITAASTPAGQEFGLVFRNCSIPDNHGITSYILGRPWQNDRDTELKGTIRAENKVVFINTKMGKTIKPQGWSLWNEGTKTEKILYAEYNTTNFEGKALQLGERLNWSKQLDSIEATTYMNDNFVFNGWSPKKYWPVLINSSYSSDLSITNFLARKIDERLVLQFNSSWPQKGVTFCLYKSSSVNDKFKQISKLISTDEIKVSYEFPLDHKLTNNTTCYQIKAFKADRLYETEVLTLTANQILETKNGNKVR